MIPPFDDLGYLPAGIHLASLDEIAERFGTESELRRVQIESLRWLVHAARRAGVKRLVINGSFVTDTAEPNDVDCVLLIASFPLAPRTAVELIGEFPFLDIEFVYKRPFDRLVGHIFATDRFLMPKGMIEVIL